MAMNPSTQNKRFGHINHARFLSATALTAAGMVLLSASAQAENWTDHTAVVGNISIDTSIPNTTNITQHTHFTKVQGNGDINAGWTVNVAQPSSSSKYVLYDTKGDPTRIMGSLNANGEIYIFDQNGVIFGADSRVDVGSLITSTGFATDSDILNNDGKLTFVEVADGAIELNGTISVAEAGLAAFVAPTISNSGVINAKMGKVAMAAGERVTLDLYGDNLVEIALDDKISGALIDNSGIINAAGGTVVLKAEAAKDIVNNVINMSGAINASSASVQGGKIVLGGGSEGTVAVSGKLDASGKAGGGKIDVKGQNVLVAETAEINADAVEHGNGGRIDLIADKNMAFHGYASAKGGSESGNGGSAEISGYETLGFNGLVDMSAENGTRGSLLLDPAFSVIHSGALPAGLLQNYVISAQALALSLANTDITLQADNFIDVGTRAGGYAHQSWTGNFITDALITAGLNTLSNGNIDLSTWNFLWFNGDTNGSLTLDSNTVNFNRNLAMGNGDLIVNGGAGGINWMANVTMKGGGDINVSTGGAQTFTNSILSTAGNINLVANGNIRQTDAVSGLIANRFSANSVNGGIDLQAQNDFKFLDDVTAKDDIDLVDRVGALSVNGTVSTQGGNIALKTNGITNAEGLTVANGAKILSNGGDITLHTNGAAGIVKGGSLTVNGQIDARGTTGTGDVSITTRQLVLNGNSRLYADLLTTDGALVNQNANSIISASGLTGTLASYAAFRGVNNDIGTLHHFTTGLHNSLNGDFTLVNASGKRLSIAGDVQTNGDNIDIQHNEELRLLSAGSLLSDGGDIRLSNQPGVRSAFVYIDGEIDSNGGDVDIESTSNIVMRNGSSIDAGTLNLVSGNVVSQASGSKIVAQKLEGTVDKQATLIGSDNNVATIGDFTTGAHPSSSIPGGFTLHDVDGFTVLGGITTKGGDIAVTTNSNSFDKAITIASSGSLKSGGGNINLNNNGANGGFITVQGSIDARGTTSNGDVTLNARQLRAQNGSTIYADLLTTNGALVNQQAGGAITAAKLVGTLTANALFAGTSNSIKEIGDFTTGLSNGNGGFTLVNASGQRLDVTGTVSTTGGDVNITHNNRLDVRSSGKIVTKGGDVDLTVNNNSFIYADGLIDARDASGNGDVTLNSQSNIEMRNGGKIYAGLVTLNSGNIVNQATGAFIDADKLQGTVDKNVNLLGSNNAIRSIGNFTTGAHAIASVPGGFKLVNGVDTDIVGAILGGQGNVDLTIDGDVNIGVGGSVNAEGGNIDIRQSGLFKSVANSLKTNGTGTINIEQRAGGSINQAVNAFDNSGAGVNTALIHDGTYTENVSIVDSNVHLISANGRGATTIEGITNGDEATLLLGGVNNVKIGGAGKGFTIVGIDNPSPGIESAAVYLKGAHDGIHIEGNEIIANGDLGLVSMYGATNNNIAIHNNIFSGKTYTGATWGVGNQWTVANVARQLVALNQGASNVSFTDNIVNGDSGNNTQVTIDAAGATITGNDFSGTTAGGYLLRARGSNTDVSGNTFDSAGLSGSAGYFLAGATSLGVPSNIPEVFAANTFIGKTVHADNYIGDQIIHTMIQPVVNAAASGANVYASAGTFNENVTLNKSLTLNGSGRTDTIIEGPGSGNGIAFAADDIYVRDLTVDNFQNGLFFGTDVADISLRNVTTKNNTRGGLFVNGGATVTNLSTNNVRFEDNNTGMFIRGSVDGLDMYGGVFARNNQGLIATFNGAPDDGSILKNASVRNVTFVNNAQKAIYMEKLSDAVFEDLDIRTSGTSGAYPVAIDINLKHQDYQNITFDGTKIRDSGTGSNGSAIAVKARNDGTYAADPASLSGLVIKNSDIVTTGAHAIVVGNDVSNAEVYGNAITGVNGITVYGGVKDLAVKDNTIEASATAIGIEGADGVEIARNDIDGAATGVHLFNTSNATVGGSVADANTIKNIVGGWNSAGIRIKDGSGNVVSYNNLENLSGQGIIAEGTWGMANTPLTIADNAITNTAHNAISLAHWNGATLSGNIIDGTTIGNGIYLDLARNTRILNNDIQNIKNDGIHLRRGNQNTTIQGNNIHQAKNGIVLGRIGSEVNTQTLIGSMGAQNPSQANTISSVSTAIQTEGAENLWVEGNVISAASFAGLEVRDGTGYTIVNFNDIDDSHDGIRLVNTSGLIAGNNVGLNGPMTGNGIIVQASNNTQILTNNIQNVSLRGISVIGGQNIDVRNNDLQAIGRSGIRIDQVDGSDVSGNKLTDIGSSGIELQAGSDAVVKGNTLNDINGNGIQASVTRNVDILNNKVDDTLLAGIYVNGIRDTNAVRGNTVSNAGQRGFYATGNNNESIVFAGNSFTDNPIGAQFQSGTIDMTGAGNTFTGGTDALVFDPTINGDPSKLVLVNDTLGTTVFTGQTGNYVTLLNGAFYDPGQPTQIDALLSRFDGLSASDFIGNIMNGADIATLEGKIWHYADDNSLGLIYFHVPAPAPGYDEEDVMAYFSPTNIQSSSMSVTINGMPQVPGGTVAQALNNLAPFAGGNDEAAFLNAITPAAGGEMSAEQLSDINPASGSAEATCWSDAAGYMQQGQAVNINYGSSFEDTLNGAAGCGGLI